MHVLVQWTEHMSKEGDQKSSMSANFLMICGWLVTKPVDAQLQNLWMLSYKTCGCSFLGPNNYSGPAMQLHRYCIGCDHM